MKRKIMAMVFLVMLVVIALSLTGCGTSIQEDWQSIVVGENLPTPQKGKLRSGSNLDTGFYGGIENVDAKYYEEYKEACIENGYTVDSIDRGDSYEAFNDEGYELSLYFYGDEIGITIVAPLKLSEIEWPTSGVGSKVPEPKSLLGKVTSNSSNSFKVVIGNTTLGEYNDYVEECEKKGFVEDYIKQEETYSAKDIDGYRLNLRYLGCNRIEIMIQTPKGNVAVSITEEPTMMPTDPPKTGNSDDKINDNFKKAMDSYEAFF